jgi:hypothetical protein
MEQMRSTWTDSRLDDFKDRVDVRFDELNGRVDDLACRMDAGFARLDGRIDALQHIILQVGGGLLAAFIAILAAMIGLIATQL